MRSLAILCTLTALACSRPAAEGAPLALATDSTSMRVLAAEQFVRDQGYSDAPPLADSSRFVPEIVELGNSWRDRLRSRHGSLLGHAVGVCEKSDHLEVIFAPPSDSRQYGRGVILHPGQPVRMVHQLYIMAYLDSASSGCRHWPS
jgi:hypothetical protein